MKSKTKMTDEQREFIERIKMLANLMGNWRLADALTPLAEMAATKQSAAKVILNREKYNV